jgi:hypothetical protein
MIETFKPIMGTSMELGWTSLALLILAAAIAWFWQDSLAARERANAAAMEACGRLSLQFLDGTVAFARLQVLRGTHSLIALRRTYVFDYTANSIERRQGFVVLTGHRLDTVGYERGDELSSLTAVTQRALRQESVTQQPASSKPINPTPLSPEPAQQQRVVNVQQLPSATNVLSLEEWRARQRSAIDKARETRHNGTHASD